MENYRETWPEGCTQSGITDSHGGYIYYDIKPLPRGRMTIGLYSNDQCSVAYEGTLTVQEVLEMGDEANYEDNEGGGGNDDGNANAYGSDFGTDEWFEKWNSALEPYKFCQPCKVSSLSNDARRRWRRLEEQEEGEEGEGGEEGEEGNGDDDGANGDDLFACQDAAGYEGANQCSMFALNTAVYPATFRDVRLATLQGTIVKSNAAGITSSPLRKWWRAWGFFTLSLIVFLIGLVLFCCLVKVKKRNPFSNANEPLLGSSKSFSSSSTTKNSNKTSKSSKSATK